MIYKKNIINKSSKENISRNNKSNSKDKNQIIKEYINYNYNSNSNSYSNKNKKNMKMKKNIIFNTFSKFKKRNLSNNLKKLYNNTNYSSNQNSFDFLDPNLDCNGNDKLKNIPIILKETKNSKIYQNLYNKDRIKKINSFYFKSPQNIRINKIFKKTE